jgi:hypothetical protein
MPPQKQGPAEEGRFPCPVAAEFSCTTTFGRKNNAALHAKKYDNAEGFPCPVAAEFSCTATFSSEDAVKRHANTHDPERFPCPVAAELNCIATFRNKDLAKKHAKKHDAERVPCPVAAEFSCTATFSRKDAAKTHAKIHDISADNLDRGVASTQPRKRKAASDASPSTGSSRRKRSATSAVKLEGTSALSRVAVVAYINMIAVLSGDDTPDDDLSDFSDGEGYMYSVQDVMAPLLLRSMEAIWTCKVTIKLLGIRKAATFAHTSKCCIVAGSV